jgi:hypothetical protein
MDTETDGQYTCSENLIPRTQNCSEVQTVHFWGKRRKLCNFANTSSSEATRHPTSARLRFLSTRVALSLSSPGKRKGDSRTSSLKSFRPLGTMLFLPPHHDIKISSVHGNTVCFYSCGLCGSRAFYVAAVPIRGSARWHLPKPIKRMFRDLAAESLQRVPCYSYFA